MFYYRRSELTTDSKFTIRSVFSTGGSFGLVTRPKYPPYRETGVAIPLSHCVFCGIADYRCYTPTSFCKNGLSQSKTDLTRGVSQKQLASEAYRSIGGVEPNNLVLYVFRDLWPSNKENPSVYWHAALYCPFMASNYATSCLVPISF